MKTINIKPEMPNMKPLPPMESVTMSDSAIRSVLLERHKIALEEWLETNNLGSLFSGIECREIQLDAVRERIGTAVYGYLYGETLPEPVEIHYPQDWWEALKARFAPAWFLKRWPVRIRKHLIDFTVVYPNFRPTLPPEQSHHRILSTTTTFTETLDPPQNS